jgi:chromosome segregation protein
MGDFTSMPRLRALALHGYKSFASKTHFEFGPAITAVVGPNGSGKSNIADAIRWALGEQSFGLLRGKRTEDMIFSGSDSRSRSGLASVTIHFDNSETWLPIEFSEVTISRRASRDGQNDYYLNGQKVRLRDITELLSQSGLAQRTYSVVGQGLVDSVLSLKADERRRLFEEAAGIELHRTRREEALRRLDATESNLDRLQDILSEVQPRLKSLSRQAERAEAYEQIRRDLKQALKIWFGYHWYELKDRLREASGQAKKASEHRNDLIGKQEAFEAGLSTAMEQLNTFRLELSELTRERSQSQDEKGSLSRRQAVSQARIQWLDEQAARISAALEAIVLRKQEVAARLEHTHAEIARLEQSLGESANGDPSQAGKSVERVAEQVLSGLDAVENAIQNVHSSALESVTKVEQALAEERNTWRELEKLHARESQLLRKALSETAKGKLSNASAATLREQLTELQDQTKEVHRAWKKATQKADRALTSQKNAFELFSALQERMQAAKEGLSEISKVVSADGEHSLGGDTLISIELEAQRSARGELEQRLARLNAEIAELEIQHGSAARERQETISAASETQHEVDARESTLVKMTDRSGQLEEGLSENERKVLTLQADDRKIRAELRNADRLHTEAQIMHARREDELASMKRRIQDDFGLVAYEESGPGPLQEPLPFKGLVERLGRVKELPIDAESQLQRLRVQLRRLGSVNPEAQKELAEVEQRIEYLTNQIDDLRAAAQQLKDLIQELDALMAHEFNKTYELVSETFQESFTRLFDGGSAQLLMSENGDRSKAGIDIRVKLPGRKEQNLAMLSGGERSLTACALIFALLKVSPPPFAILDEVDAMLDESNVGRFCEIVRELSRDTQFLIITHNRLTIQEADVVYGVSLGEDNASRVISLRLDQAEQALAA